MGYIAILFLLNCKSRDNTKPPIIMQVLFQNIFKKVFSSELKG